MLRRLIQRSCALAILLALSLSTFESLTCAEEQGMELVAQHQAELRSAGETGSIPAEHCCPCIHTFVSTVQALVTESQQVAYTTRFTFLPAVAPDYLTEPLVPPPIA